MNCRKEIRWNKCLAEAGDGTLAFGIFGSMHANLPDGTCCSTRSVALLCSSRPGVFAGVLEASTSAGGQ